MLELKELRRRWTIELNSLGRRNDQSPKQASRIRDLQSFLATIDPLRKLEFEWASLPSFKMKLEAELELQHKVSSTQFQEQFYVSILQALVNKPLGEPSDPCEVTPKAKFFSEDHGENLNNVIQTMLDLRLLRKDYKTNALSLSTVGANLMEKISVQKLNPISIENYKGAALINALGSDVLHKLAELRIKLEDDRGSQAAETRELPTYLDKSVDKIVFPPGKRKSHKKDKPIVLQYVEHRPAKVSSLEPQKTTPPSKKKIPTLAEAIEKYEKNAANEAVLLQNLINAKLISTTLKELTSQLTEDPALNAIWTARLSVSELGGLVFEGSGPTKILSFRNAASKVIAALKDVNKK